MLVLDGSLDEAREKAEAFAQANIVELCKEMLEFENTAVLSQGKVRELEALCGYAGQFNGLKVARALIATFSMKKVVESA